MKHVREVGLETCDNKVHKLLFTNINKREKRMKIIDFVMIRGKQLFEEGKEINLIKLKIEDNKIQNIFETYKYHKIRFKLNRI